MKPLVLSSVLSIILSLAFLCQTEVFAQMGGRDGRCPMCGGMMGGQRGQISIPEKLPVPKNTAWVQGLRQIHALEKYSKSQYEEDSGRHNARMPYAMILWQEDNHIDWIGKMFSAYGLPSDSPVPPVKQTSSLKDAYELGYTLEKDLVSRYEWLVKNAEDQESRDVLDFILMQTRMHATMFLHVMGTGRMGPGMMH
jgi:hypothetical protein